MRVLVAVILSLWAVAAHAQDWEDRRVFGDGARVLRILSSTDTVFVAPIIARFIAARPGVSVEYLVTGTADLDRLFRADPGGYDAVISSAMDLQLRLANDGLARRLTARPGDLPDWAQWRQSLFAFTSEPAAIVLRRDAFEGRDLPRSRQELIEALRARPEVFRGRIGTYDVRRSGLGYLFATQDARASETYWRLMEVMGRLDLRLYCCSGDMIDDLASGDLLVAYNVLGSYAAARVAAEDDGLAIILPSDFPTMMMRSVLVSRDAAQPALAEAFVSHLLAEQSAPGAPLPPLARGTGASIPLDAALLTFLDRLKRRTFLEEWENAAIQSAPDG